LKGVALGDELGLEGFKVFDDAVVHHGDAPALIEMRVGIEVGGRSMGCPSGVAEPDRSQGGFGLQQEGEAVIDLPLFLADFEFAIAEQSDPGTVIAAVFESAQTIED
jgi:hypothetical protein